MKHQLLLASAGLAAALALVVARRGGAPRAVRGAGTLPPHRDPDGGFRNPWRTAHREGGFLRWQRERLGADLPPNPPPGALPLVPNHLARPHAAPDEIRLTWVGHATWVLQIGGLNLLTDPHWSERAFPVQWAGPARFQPPGIRWDDLPAIDAVLLSHDHYDHLDRNTVHRLRERFGERLRWLVPLGYRAWFRGEGVDVAELDWWQTATLDGPAGPVRVTCLPSQHWTRRTLWDERERLWSSWAVGGGGRRVYFAGDTGWFPGFAEIGQRAGPFDALLFPIGAYAPRWFMRPAHMNPEDAVRAYREMGGRGVFIGMHWGTWRLTDEDPLEPPIRTRAAWAAAGLPPERLWIPRHGATLQVPRVASPTAPASLR